MAAGAAGPKPAFQPWKVRTRFPAPPLLFCTARSLRGDLRMPCVPVGMRLKQVGRGDWQVVIQRAGNELNPHRKTVFCELARNGYRRQPAEARNRIGLHAVAPRSLWTFRPRFGSRRSFRRGSRRTLERNRDGVFTRSRDNVELVEERVDFLL